MSFLFHALPHTEARDRIAKLPLVSREVMDGMLPELKAYAFTVTGLDVGDQMAKTRDLIAAVPAGEKTWAKARKEIAAELSEGLGGKEAQRRAELLLRTHVFRSYAATRYRTLMQQVDVFPWWQYKTHGDGNVRPSHAALNGKIFPAGHQVWQRIFPPWDWGCRCLVVPLSQRSADALVRSGKPSSQAAKDAHLLPTQVATPERFSDHEASSIDKAQRLPGGISLNHTPTWSDSPWSIPGNIQHDWTLIKARYSDQPEVLAAFEQWASQQEIEPGVTVSMWIGEGVATKTVKEVKAVKTVAQPVAAAPAISQVKTARALKPETKALQPAKPLKVRPYMTQPEIEDLAISQVNDMSLDDMKQTALDYAQEIKLPKSTQAEITRSRGKGEARSRAIQSRMRGIRREMETLQAKNAKPQDIPSDDSDLVTVRPKH